MTQVTPYRLTGDKVANLGGEPSREFEKSFANLAYSYIKNRSARLMEYAVGFQLVDRSKDNERAVGVFACKIGNSWLYVPAFFINGRFKGHEMLYVKAKDRFVPLKENWVNKLISRHPEEMGRGTPRDFRNQGIRQPDMWRYGHGTGTYKFGFAIPDVFPALLQAQPNALFRENVTGTIDVAPIAKNWSAFSKAASANTQPLLSPLLEKSAVALKRAKALADEYPEVQAGFVRFYGKDCFQKWAQAQQLSQLRQATNDSLLPDTELDFFKVARPVVEIYQGVERIHDTPGLPEDVREELLAQNYSIRDKRAADQISQVYQVKQDLGLVNPTQSGVYSVLQPDGSMQKMVIIIPKGARTGVRDTNAYIFDMSADSVGCACLTSDIWTTGPLEGALDNTPRQQFAKWLDDHEGLDRNQLTSHASCLVMGVSRTGDVTPVLSVAYGYKDNDEISVYTPSAAPGSVVVRPEHCSSRRVLVFDRAKGIRQRFLTTSDAIYVPQQAKILHLCGEKKTFGRPLDIHLRLGEKTANLRVSRQGTSSIVLEPEGRATVVLSKAAAICHLVGELGCSEQAAKDMVTFTGATQRQDYRVKYADDYGTSVNIYRPEDNITTIRMGRQMMNYQPEHESHRKHRVEGENYAQVAEWNGWNRYTEEDFANAVATAEEAAKTGDNTLFDVSVFATMTKAVSSDVIIDRYAAPLQQLVDKLCRLLFMFYWHQDAFASRYGEQEMPALEDGIRNAIETAGDVAFFLSEQAAEADDYGGDNESAIDSDTIS